MTKSTQVPPRPQNGDGKPDNTAEPPPAPETPTTATPEQTPRQDEHGRPNDDSDPGHS